MAFSNDVFPAVECCEICGTGLDDEIVIQEFADGSLARLCAECAAGAALEAGDPSSDDAWPADGPRWLDDRGQQDGSRLPGAEAAPFVDRDPMDVTKELLPPVVDLLALQGEMQGALRRLASTLEGFTGGTIAENVDKAAVAEERVRVLELELERAQARLRETEFLLQAATDARTDTGASEEAAAETDADAAIAAQLPQTEWTVPLSEAAPVAPPSEAAPVAPPSEVVPVAPPSEVVPVAAPSETADDAATTPATAVPDIPAIPIALREPAAAVPPAGETRQTFRIEEVQAAQRYFNESPFTRRTREIRLSLGKPQGNLTRAPGSEPLAFITIAWNIVWYQYLVDLRRDVPSDQRVVLHCEGMDLNELAHYFREKNASVDDDGRLDASELEVRLLSDPSTLITEMTPDEEKALEDRTEEIWDHRMAPEFKWDD